MSHGVTSRTANLTYSNESGGLNEATSDIFGTMVEFYASNAYDTPDYIIGEKLFRSGTSAIRSMIRPSVDGRSADCWYSGVGSLDVHGHLAQGDGDLGSALTQGGSQGALQVFGANGELGHRLSLKHAQWCVCGGSSAATG